MSFKNPSILAALAASLLAAQAQAAPGDTIQQAVQRGANFLTPDVFAFSQANACQACHRQGGGLFALAEAVGAGYTVNTTDANGLGYIATRAIQDQLPDGGYRYLDDLEVRNSKTSYAALGIAGYTSRVSTRYSAQLVQMADWIVGAQTTSSCTLPNSTTATCGRWVEEHGSYPTTFGDLPITARMMTALAAARPYGNATQVAAYDLALARAVNFIRANRNSSVQGLGGFRQDIAYALIGLRAAGVATADADLQFIRTRLVLAATGSGGWAAQAGQQPNPYTTGLSLYALCKIGEPISSLTVSRALNLLNASQLPDGSWSGLGFGFSTYDVPTTFALLGAACYASLGVDVSVVGADQQEIEAGSAGPQARSFTVRVSNTGAVGNIDTYDLSASGGLPGWSVSLSQSTVTLAPGASIDVTATVTAPAGVAPAVPLTFGVRAQSQISAATSDAVNVVVYTSPSPPVGGQPTVTTIIAGNGVTITERLGSYTFSARVSENGVGQVGPGVGVVTFHVAGVAVGADTDANGDGIFTATWTPGLTWNGSGTQDLRAIFSGVDRPDPATDLAPSMAMGSINVGLAIDGDGDGISDELESFVVFTNPNDADTDNDRCNDGQEYFVSFTDPLAFDMDGDGTGDCDELQSGTNPFLDSSFPDFDQDSVSDGADYFPCDVTRTAVQFIPGEAAYGQLMFEDQWPKKGDYDFNDAVIAYNYQLYYNAQGRVSGLRLTIEPRATGAQIRNGLALRLPTSNTALGSATRSMNGGPATPISARSSDSDLVVDLTPDFREFFTAGGEFINTQDEDEGVDGVQGIVTLTFVNPIVLDLSREPFDLFFFRSTAPSHEVHRPLYDGTAGMDTSLFGQDDDGTGGGRFFVDSGGVPFVLSLPELTPWPAEYTGIQQLFPGILAFGASGGASNVDFYKVGTNPGAAHSRSRNTLNPDFLDPVPPLVPSRACTVIPFGG
jgi:LruC domain-containing protein